MKVALRSAKDAFMDAAFAERRATISLQIG
jgi:hypothetical protein